MNPDKLIMKITEVKINLVQRQEPVRAFASITLENCFVVHDLRIIKTAEKTFVAMPSKKIKVGKDLGNQEIFKDIAHPINKTTRNEIETMVLEEYQKTIRELNESS